jgi:hypothetical protein
MYFLNKIFIISIFLLLSVSFGFCEEMSDHCLISGRDIWRSLNYFDHDKFINQQKALYAKEPDGLGLRGAGINTGIGSNIYKYAKSITDILEITSKENEDFQIKFSLNQFIIKENEVYGYQSGQLEIYQLENREKSLYSHGVSNFIVVSEQWSEKLDLSSRDTARKNPALIRVEFYFLPFVDCFYEKICEHIAYKLTFGSAPLDIRLNLYRLDKGPGDVCLAKVNSSHSGFVRLSNPEKNYVWNDQQVIFIRSNIFVSLTSYYKNFGCMDLACRLDALIVEQMKKQQEKEKIEKKGNTNE